MSGPLSGLRIVEFTGLGPVPFAAMLLADMGATVIRLDRPGGYPSPDPKLDAAPQAALCNRSRPCIRVDLKSGEGRALAMRLIAQADALIEGYRPGTLERLGLGPEPCLAANPALAYVRATGWGQTGPLSDAAGHDLNYIGLSGALSLFTRDGAPPPAIPPLIGDMGGGALYAALGLLAATLCARMTGTGQVVDAAMVDGSASLYTLLAGLHAAGAHAARAGENLLDGGRYYYRCYRCADGLWITVGAIEPAFRAILLERLDLSDDPRFAPAAPEAQSRAALTALFASAPRAHWLALFEGGDACVGPVLDLDEAPRHAANRARDAFLSLDGVAQPAPAPRFAETPSAVSLSPAQASAPDPQALRGWGFDEGEIAALRASGALA